MSSSFSENLLPNVYQILEGAGLRNFNRRQRPLALASVDLLELFTYLLFFGVECLIHDYVAETMSRLDLHKLQPINMNLLVSLIGP